MHPSLLVMLKRKREWPTKGGAGGELTEMLRCPPTDFSADTLLRSHYADRVGKKPNNHAPQTFVYFYASKHLIIP